MEEKISKIIDVLLTNEDKLSDGFGYYCGAERVSENAKVALKDILEDYAEEICSKAVRIAMHSGRKTVKDSDLKLAVK